jgi:tRNA (mo5U34)-methyltransferase
MNACMMDQAATTPPSLTRDEIERRISSVPMWWHSIDVGQGVHTSGHKSPTLLASELQALHLPDLRDKTVLDIGAWDGYFSFAAERMGAKSVTALDHYVWSIDWAEHLRRVAECAPSETTPKPFETRPYFRPSELPGKCGFDTAHDLLGSRVQTVVADFMNTDVKEVGNFDVVLFLGVLYHMKYPLEALERLAALTREVAVIETEAVFLPGLEDHAFCEFFEKEELQNDPTNWWAPNEKALIGMCRAAGFRHVTVVPKLSRLSKLLMRVGIERCPLPVELGSGPARHLARLGVRRKHLVRYRAVVQAWK